jgi:predicted ATPase
VLPGSEISSRLELTLQTALMGPLIATKGYAAPEIQTAAARAIELCNALGETRTVFPVLYAQWAVSYASGHAARGHELAAEFLRRAEEQTDDALLVVGHRLVGHSAFVVAKLGAARSHSEEAIARYDPDRHCKLAFVYGTDPRIMAEGVLASSLWQLGLADQSRTWTKRALEDADAVRHLNTTGYAMIWCAAFPSTLMRDAARTRAFAQRAGAFADENQLPLWKAWARVFLACALAELGHADEAVAIHRAMIDALASQRFNLLRGGHLVWLAQAYGAAGHSEDGLHALADAKAVMLETGEKWLEADCHRVRGDLLRQLGSRWWDEAEGAFADAVRIAHEQGAKSLELRAATRLGQLWEAQGRREQARRLVAPLTGRFSEGFDTADVREAVDLLERLAVDRHATL